MYVYLFKIVDYYMITIGDMQNEKSFYDHCNEFQYKHDYEKVTTLKRSTVGK